MITSIKDFFIGVLGSLFATFLTTYVFQFIKLGETFNFKTFLDMIVTYKFLIYWILLLLIVLIIRKYIRKKIDSIQTPYPSVISVASSYDLESEAEAYGFKWKVHADVRRKSSFKNEIVDIKVGRVEGPYCKYDYRGMKVSRTYFGRYKYKCPKCNYKKILLKDTWTLESDIEDEIEAQYRTKMSAK
ncbi:hypothetical protein [Priestia aryabhattai]|uniref:hypothetical protein n=1 Tax=Priestia aryabhattai TaxID=412384 RepID=UPI0030C963A9